MAKSFYEFMLQYKDRNTPRGDLARDMIYMQTRHPEEGDLNRIDSEHWFMCYLSEHRTCDECCAVARRCRLNCSPCQGQMNLTVWKM